MIPPSVPWEGLPKLGAAQMNQVFMLATGKYGLDGRVLIEHAARTMVELIEHLAPDGPILTVAGRGHNGACGLATARLLAARGRQVWAVPTHDASNYSGIPHEQLEQLKHYPNVRVKSSVPKMKFGCAVDAAIGTRLDGPPRGRALDMITVLNRQTCTVVALDVPTGLDADDGSTPGEVVQATATLALAAPKRGAKPGGAVGELYLADLALPPALYGDLDLPAVDVRQWLSRITP